MDKIVDYIKEFIFPEAEFIEAEFREIEDDYIELYNNYHVQIGQSCFIVWKKLSNDCYQIMKQTKSVQNLLFYLDLIKLETKIEFQN